MRNSTTVVNTSNAQTLSNQGNQQQFSFNTGDATTPVAKLFNGFLERDKLGEFRFETQTGMTGITMTLNRYSANDTAIGGWKTPKLSYDDFQDAGWNLGLVGVTISIEYFDEYSRDKYAPTWSANAWGINDPSTISMENFDTGFTEGTRPTKDSPRNCGTDGTTGGQVFNEDLSSQINGSNRGFVVSQNYIEGSLRGYQNGQRISNADIIETGSSTFSLSYILSIGEVLYIDYLIPTT